MTETTVNWTQLSRDAGRKINWKGRLWLFLMGFIGLIAPGMSMVIFMRVIATVIDQDADNPEEISAFVRALASK